MRGAGVVDLLTTLLLTSFLHLCLCRISFVKDQSVEFQFPPQIVRPATKAIPVGHLRPLGWQRRPDGQISEEVNTLSPEDFFNRYVQTKKPVSLRGAMKNLPALNTWKTDAYLKENYGTLEVHAMVKTQLIEMAKPRRMKFRKFLREYQYEDWYLSNIVPQEMMHELPLPHVLSCGTARTHLLESELWMSSGVTSSLLHSHADHTIHCLLSGRKDFLIIEPTYRHWLEYTKIGSQPGDGYANMDMEIVNMFKYPRVADVPWRYSTLKPGDCVFIPARYLHHVRSHGRSISHTVLWAPHPEIDFSDCPEIDHDVFEPLTEANFVWTYANADRTLYNRKLNSASTRHLLCVLMRDSKKLTRDQFTEFYEEIMSEIDDHAPVNDVWKLISPDNQKHVQRSVVEKMDDKTMEELAKLLNKPNERIQSHDEL